MSIAILFESHEWSSFVLVEDIRSLVPQVEVQLYDLETEVDVEEILSHDLIVSRIFASAQFRGHQRSLVIVQDILERARGLGKVLLNSYEAHFYEIDKYLTGRVMAQHGLPMPEIYGCFRSSGDLDGMSLEYPCIIKPNCGGRTTDTYVLHTSGQLTALLPQLNPEITYIAQIYIKPKEGFVTRIEVIGGRLVQILKKALAANGLAAYHLGSEFYPYPKCPADVQALALRTMELMNIEMGSLDIIETDHGSYVIDVNSVSNTSEDCIEMFNFDLMSEMAKYIICKHRLIQEVGL